MIRYRSAKNYRTYSTTFALFFIFASVWITKVNAELTPSEIRLTKLLKDSGVLDRISERPSKWTETLQLKPRSIGLEKLFPADGRYAIAEYPVDALTDEALNEYLRRKFYSTPGWNQSLQEAAFETIRGLGSKFDGLVEIGQFENNIVTISTDHKYRPGELVQYKDFDLNEFKFPRPIPVDKSTLRIEGYLPPYFLLTRRKWAGNNYVTIGMDVAGKIFIEKSPTHSSGEGLLRSEAALLKTHDHNPYLVSAIPAHQKGMECARFREFVPSVTNFGNLLEQLESDYAKATTKNARQDILETIGILRQIARELWSEGILLGYDATLYEILIYPKNEGYGIKLTDFEYSFRKDHLKPTQVVGRQTARRYPWIDIFQEYRGPLSRCERLFIRLGLFLK
jgi:hypothetical protein